MKGQGRDRHPTPESWHSSLAPFFLWWKIMGRCHILGLKGYRNIIKKQAEDSARVTRIHYPWVGTVFLCSKVLCKKGWGRHPYLRVPGRVLYFCDFNIWDSRFVADYECLTRCIQCHECDCHNRNGNQWRIDGFRTPIDSSHTVFDLNGTSRQTYIIKRA